MEEAAEDVVEGQEEAMVEAEEEGEAMEMMEDDPDDPMEEEVVVAMDDDDDDDDLLSLLFLGFRFLVWMLSFFIVRGRLTLCSLKYRPQALHTGSPWLLRRQREVTVVWQLVHI